MNNVNMANMNMGGPVGAPMPMMNNGAMPPQNAPRQNGQVSNDTRTSLNTYIYEYFLRSGMTICARSILDADPQIRLKDERRDENGNLLGNGLGDDAMDTDSKDGIKYPDGLPAPNIPQAYPDSCFLVEWFALFWDMLNAQKKNPTPNGVISQYVAHTQAQSRMRQHEQQQMMRNIRPDQLAQQQYQQRMMQNMQNGQMNMMKGGNTLRQTAISNNQGPQMQQMLQQKAGQMQGNPEMDGNRGRPASPGSTDNAPSPKRPRLEGPVQGMMPNGGRPGQGMPGQQMAFGNPNPAVQANVAKYAANLKQHHGNQMPNKPMPNANMPQGQGSPMVPQGGDAAAIGGFYNQGDMNAAQMRPGQGQGQAGGSNHALQDYQMQLMLLEQQNKKRLMMARQEQDITGTMQRADGPVGPGGPGGMPGNPNGPPFQGQSPPGGRPGASPGPNEQIKRGQQMGNGPNMGSPLPEGAQNRNSPNAINFMPGQQMVANPNAAPHFFNGVKEGMEINMVNAQMNGNMRPPSSHPGGQPFNGPMNAQMMAARQAQQGGPGGPQVQQWQQGPNGQMGPQGPQPQTQGTPQQRNVMPPPQAPAPNNANSRNTTSSPQVAAAAPPTPSQANKAAPKKKEGNKSNKAKTAANKKSNSNLSNAGATPAAEPSADAEPPTPATPITPVPPPGFNKAQNAGAAVANGQQIAQAPAPAPAPVAQPPPDPTQATGFGMDAGSMEFSMNMDFADPLTSQNVLDGFDFDSFLHDGAADDNTFDFSGAGGFSMEGGEIGAD